MARTAKTTLTCFGLAATLAVLTPASRAAQEQAAGDVPRMTVAEPAERAASAVSSFERLVERPIERVTSAAGVVVASAASAATLVATTAASSATHAAVDAATVATAAVFSVANVATGTAVSAANAAANAAATLFQSGRISFYADKFHGKRTASGSPYDAEDLTMAHRTLPIGTQVMITNTANQRSVVVTVNDRGPYSGGRVADLSRAAAEKLNMVRTGIAEATLQVLPNAGNKQDSKTRIR